VVGAGRVSKGVGQLARWSRWLRMSVVLCGVVQEAARDKASGAGRQAYIVCIHGIYGQTHSRLLRESNVHILVS